MCCDTPAAPDMVVATGSWGGVGIRLDVTAQGATTEYDCAHGTIDQPLVTDRAGRFSAAGTHVREHGGPIRVDEPPDRHPARYDGTLAGTTIHFTVAMLDTQQVIGPFDAIRDVAGRIVKCL